VLLAPGTSRPQDNATGACEFGKSVAVRVAGEMNPIDALLACTKPLFVAFSSPARVLVVHATLSGRWNEWLCLTAWAVDCIHSTRFRALFFFILELGSGVACMCNLIRHEWAHL
jgi:hypothetical protein